MIFAKERQHSHVIFVEAMRAWIAHCVGLKANSRVRDVIKKATFFVIPVADPAIRSMLKSVKIVTEMGI